MKVYIVCPANVATGGTELLHQFSKALSDNHCENYMVYVWWNGIDNPVPEAFSKYGVKYVSSYVDDADSVLVCPETQVRCVDWCKKGTAMVWWLSVDFYLSAHQQMIQDANMQIDVFSLKKRSNVIHFVQSYYAKSFLESVLKIKQTFFLKDYINDEITNIAINRDDSEQRENICLYNPKKGYRDIEPVIKACRDDITWVPLQGMTAEEMARTMCKARVYVDFGAHPGKDRIPREAAVCGCCIMTNTRGSAAYQGDVNIPKKYKIEDTANVHQVLEQIYDLVDHYEERSTEFHVYREGILKEKAEFAADTRSAIDILKKAVTGKKKGRMSRAVRKQLFETFETLLEVHQLTEKMVMGGEMGEAVELLTDCQNCAIAIGTQIETVYGEERQSIHALENYCEMIYQLTQVLGDAGKCSEIYRQSNAVLQETKRFMEEEIPDKLEVVFLPYKVSMWDSMESVWMAAKEDPSCDAYVIPIPYYDKNPDGSFKAEHYEGDKYPSDVSVVHYNDYNFELRRPDVIFIHNPYDQYNNVTSVHPFFYSKNLKQFTDCLVYIPYYSTAGGMSEAQSQCMAYYFADYIVIQAEKYRKFFDPDLPQDKLLPLGSPKFDKVVRLCKNPPPAPDAWRAKMAGKKVYFYNTSITGMLGNTPVFLKKMEYVFKCFEGREDACLVWRPHPLLESTFASMRSSYKPAYDALKKYYIESDFGIYDDTPEITNTIALCDAYIGDSGTSVTSLFGIAGKPVFVLNNYIDCKPDADDWRGEIIKGFPYYGNHEWMIAQGNKLYRSPERNYNYKYFCDLSDYTYGNYYGWVIRAAGRDYVCPMNARDILLIGENGIEKKIELENCMEQRGAFYGAVASGRFLFLIPNRYPAIVRYDTLTGKLDYLKEHLDIFAADADGERRVGGFCVYKEYVFIASPIDNQVLAVHAKSGKMQVLTTGAENSCGCNFLIAEGDDLWLLPYEGYVITRWNPESGEVQEYTGCPSDLKCKHPILGYECDMTPFGLASVSEQYIYLAPWWGNMYLKVNKKTGEITEWNSDFEVPGEMKNGYFLPGGNAYFLYQEEGKSKNFCSLFSQKDRKLYEVNLQTEEFHETKIEFDMDELRQNEPGFGEYSEWLKYCCVENSFNTLSDFLDGNVSGNQFDRNRQMEAYSEIAANHDGTSGDKIYEYVRKQLFEQ